MESSPPRQIDDQRIERQLLEQVQTAHEAFCVASAEYRRLRAEFGEMLDHPDGSHAVRQSAARERAALGR